MMEREKIKPISKEQRKQKRLQEDKEEALSTIREIGNDLTKWGKMNESHKDEDDEQILNTALSVLFGIRHRVRFSLSAIRPSVFRGSGFILTLWLSLFIYLAIIVSRNPEGQPFALSRAFDRLSLIFFLCFVIGLLIILQNLVNMSGVWKAKTWQIVLVLWGAVFTMGLTLHSYNALLWLVLIMCSAIILILLINVDV